MNLFGTLLLTSLFPLPTISAVVVVNLHQNGYWSELLHILLFLMCRSGFCCQVILEQLRKLAHVERWMHPHLTSALVDFLPMFFQTHHLSHFVWIRYLYNFLVERYLQYLINRAMFILNVLLIILVHIFLRLRPSGRCM